MTKLLFVEDDLVVLEDLTTITNWQAAGYEICTAVNGRQGYKRYEEFQPQIVVTDVKMPLMDGLEMMQAILQENPAVQFMLLSAYEDFAYLQEAIRLGARDYIRKTSITETLLLEKVNALQQAWHAIAADTLAILKGMFQELCAGNLSGCGQMRKLCGRFPSESVLFPLVEHMEKDLKRALPRDMSAFDLLEKTYCAAYSHAVTQAVSFIQAAYADSGLSNTVIAAHVGMSERRLAERFKAETGHTINDFITLTRMEAAKKLLRNGHMIYETAELTGYNTPQYFGSVFKGYTGMTPSEYQAEAAK